MASLKALRKFQRLTLRVEVVSYDRVTTLIATARLFKRIASMCLLLVDSTQLEEVTVIVADNGGIVDDLWYKAILPPFAFLCDRVEIRFSGLSPRAAAERLRDVRLRNLTRSVRLDTAGALLISAREMREKSATRMVSA